MWPVVQYLILCDDVQTDPNNLLRVNLFGLITTIRSTATPPFPVVRPMFCALVVLAGCQGVGELSLRIVQNTNGRIIFRTQPRRLRFTGSAQDAVGVTFRIRNCTFPDAGLYWVEVIYTGVVIGRRALRLTS
jgi:hypothetical protein